jgi:hypothetical protein
MITSPGKVRLLRYSPQACNARRPSYAQLVDPAHGRSGPSGVTANRYNVGTEEIRTVENIPNPDAVKVELDAPARSLDGDRVPRVDYETALIDDVGIPPNANGAAEGVEHHRLRRVGRIRGREHIEEHRKGR